MGYSGAERGSADALSTLATSMGGGLQTPTHIIRSLCSIIFMNLMISTVVKDWMIQSENDRDLTLASDSTAKVQNKALVLSGDKSYVETPIEQLAEEGGIFVRMCV